MFYHAGGIIKDSRKCKMKFIKILLNRSFIHISIFILFLSIASIIQKQLPLTYFTSKNTLSLLKIMFIFKSKLIQTIPLHTTIF